MAVVVCCVWKLNVWRQIVFGERAVLKMLENEIEFQARSLINILLYL